MAYEQVDWDSINAKKTEQILWSQSWNLAVEMCKDGARRWVDGADTVSVQNDKQVKEHMEYWQKYFYSKLMREGEKEKEVNIKSRKYEQKDRGRSDAEDNANELYNQYQQENN